MFEKYSISNYRFDFRLISCIYNITCFPLSLGHLITSRAVGLMKKVYHYRSVRLIENQIYNSKLNIYKKNDIYKNTIFHENTILYIYSIV